MSFCERMERVLGENDEKGGWHGAPQEYLLSRLLDEYEKLAEALQNQDGLKAMNECVDVANFAMMICDNIYLGLHNSK